MCKIAKPVFSREMYNLSKSMQNLEIPEDIRRKYIKETFTGIFSGPIVRIYLKNKLEELTLKNIKGAEAIKEIEEDSKNFSEDFMNQSYTIHFPWQTQIYL